MKKALLVFAIGAVALTSCQKSKEELITGKWKAVRTENPFTDSVLNEQKVFIDTFGNAGTPEQNMELYGTGNVDSLRGLLRQNYDEQVSMIEHSIQNTTFIFKKNNVAILDFSGQVDSSKWSFNKEGKLVLDESALKGEGTPLVLDVEHLDEDSLILKMTDQGYSSSTIFVPVKE